MKAFLWSVVIAVFALPSVFAQNMGSIRGTVTLADRDLTLPHVTILISQFGRSVETNDDGVFAFDQVPPGTYTLVANRSGLSSERQTITVVAGQTAAADFKLGMAPIVQEITVTAAGVEQSVFEAFQSVSTLDAFALAERGATSVGEVLDNQPGVAKRSFGPGTARPVIRGFDGDRVLVMEDGVRTGTLSSQSGDHGEPIDVMSIERLEVVKGPATLLYGSNAMGGVVNAVSRHYQMKETSQDGIRGYLTGGGASNNSNGFGSAGFEYGTHDWLIWGNGGNQKTRDYSAGGGSKIENSGSRLSSGGAGVGWFGNTAFVSAGYNYDDGIYGIPLEPGGEEIVRLDFFRRSARISGGYRDTDKFGGLRFNLNYSGWRHKELDFAEPGPPVLGTLFNNKQYTYEFAYDQKPKGRLTGTIGFYGMHRDYITTGEEAIAPPVKGNVNAVFGLETISFARFNLQFGGRLEGTRYDPEGAQHKSFTGLSGGVGINIPLWKNGAFVANYTHSSRAPALEELYNNGPHPGNQAFEIGNPNLKRERNNGIDLSVRHLHPRLRAEANFFVYDLGNFVFLSFTGNEQDGLREALYTQGNSRYRGAELILNTELHRNVWLDLGFDYVNAQLKLLDTPLPRIPPARAHIGLEGRYRGFSVKPQVIMAHNQRRVFADEAPTPGYVVFNLNASYTHPTRHFSHHIAFDAFNLGDRLYYNHVSLIKEIAPEIGRGVKVSYSVRFF
jgi:iron complex outermembrane receptor protein